MADGKNIDAKIRIGIMAEQAMKALRDLRRATKEVADEGAALGATGAGDAGAARTAAATQAATAARKAAAAERQAERQAAKDAAAADRATAAQKRADERAALADAKAAAAERKKLAREVADAERKAQKDAADAAKKTSAEKVAADRAADKSASAARNQAQQLSYQITDIVQGLTTGQAPFTVLMQQGGQLTSIFGGMRGAASALLSVFTPLRLVVGGLATVVGTVAIAAYQGYSEQDKLNKTLALTGTTAGTTAGQLGLVAKQVANQANTSVGSVRSTLAALLQTGVYTESGMASASRAATAYAKLSGEAAEDVAVRFSEQADGVAAWAAKQNKALNYLTVEQYKYIRSLEAQGRTQQAMRVNNDALSAALEQRAAPAVGTLEKAWNLVGKTVKDVWDTLKDIGREETAVDRVQKLTKELAALQRQRKGDVNPFIQQRTDGQIAEKQAELDAAESDKRQERAAAQKIAERAQAEANKIKKQGAPALAAVAQEANAVSQKALAETLASLDKQQAAVDRAYANGLSSAEANELALNTIEKRRIEAQRKAINDQIAIERARGQGDATPEEQQGTKARVIGLEGQLVALDGQLAVNLEKRKSIVESKALESARERATQWAEVWQKAADQVRAFQAQNAAAAAERVVDPQARAAAQAELAVAEAKRNLAELQRDLNLQISLTLDPQDRAVLEGQLAEVTANGKAVIEEMGRSATQQSFTKQFGEQADDLDRKLRNIDRQEQRGAITAVQAEQRKNAERAKSKQVLDELLARMEALAQTPDEKAAVASARATVDEVTTATNAAGEAMNTVGKSAITNFFGKITDGSQSARGAVRDLFSDILKGALNIINQRIGESLADSLFPKSGASGGSSFLATAGNFLTDLLQFHEGSGSPQVRSVPALAAMQAIATGPRFHTGLRSNELLAVLEDDETVLTKEQTKDVAGALKRGGGAGAPSVAISVKVEGATGSASQQQTAANELGADLSRVVDERINVWATRQSRAGGILNKG